MMLTGEPPFDGDNREEIFKAISKGNISFQKPEIILLSSEVKDIIAKLLVKTPKHRFNTNSAYKHPWVAQEINRGNSNVKVNDGVLSQLKRFSMMNK